MAETITSLATENANPSLRALLEGEPTKLLRVHRHGRRGAQRVAQRLGGEPVLAIAAVQIAAEHPEAHRQRAGQRVEERFLLNRIALQRAEIIRRDE